MMAAVSTASVALKRKHLEKYNLTFLLAETQQRMLLFTREEGDAWRISWPHCVILNCTAEIFLIFASAIPPEFKVLCNVVMLYFTGPVFNH